MVCIDEVDLAEAREQGTLAGLVLVDHNKLTEPLQGLGEVRFLACCVIPICLHFPLSSLAHSLAFVQPLFFLISPFPPSLTPSSVNRKHCRPPRRPRPLRLDHRRQT